MIVRLQHMYFFLFYVENVDNLFAKELQTNSFILFEPPRYKQLLTYIKSAVTRNHSEKSINSILDYISTSKQVRPIFFQVTISVSFIFILQMELLQNFYETTLDALRDAKNERLWFKTMTKLGKLYFDRLLASSNT